MNRNLEALSEEQQNDCRAAMQEFVDSHGLSAWGMTIRAQKKARGRFSLNIALTPPSESGLATLPLQEIIVPDTSFDVGAEVKKTLELAYRDRFPTLKKQ